MPKPPPEIVVVDYDAGNLRSVQRALEAVGQRPLVTSDPRDVETRRSAGPARRRLGPGLHAQAHRARAGRTAAGVRGLGPPVPRRVRRLAAAVRRAAKRAAASSAWASCPAWCVGSRRGRAEGAQIGWNAVWLKYDHPLLDGIPGGSYFYFVHSYYADPADAEITHRRSRLRHRFRGHRGARQRGGDAVPSRKERRHGSAHLRELRSHRGARS